jgi:hypothetical protein
VRPQTTRLILTKRSVTSIAAVSVLQILLIAAAMLVTDRFVKISRVV